MKKIVLFFSLFLSIPFSYSQQDLSLFGLNDLVANNKLNPAFIGDYRIGINIASLSYNLYSNGPSLYDFIRSDEAGNTSNILQYPSNKLLNSKGNLFRAGSELETFRFVYQQNNWSANIHHASKVNGIVNYSGSLVELAIRGNAPFIGQNVPLDTGFEVFSYEEIGVGGAVNLGKIKIGGRVKYLSGHSTISTRRSKVSIYTDDDIYQLELDMDVKIDVASSEGRDFNLFNFGPISYQAGDTEDAIVNTGNFLFDISDDLFKFSPNSGIAFDLGINWQINEKLSLDISALDLGKIKWKDNPKNFTAKEIFEFDGLSLGLLTFDGKETVSFDNLQDSLKVIKFAETNNQFSTNLPAQFYLGVGYQLNDKWRFNGTIYHSKFKNNSLTAILLGANFQVHKAINIGTTYSMMNEESFLLGLNAVLQLGSVQVFALTDNVFGVFNPQNGRTLNARVGVGFAFGNRNLGEDVEKNKPKYQ